LEVIALCCGIIFLFEIPGKPFTDFNTGIWTIFIIFISANIGLSILLLLGAKAVSKDRMLSILFYTWQIIHAFLMIFIPLCSVLQRCTKKLKAWFYIRIVTTGLTVLTIIISACFEISVKLILFDFFYTTYRLFTLWVIYVFIGEIIYEEIFYTKKSNEFPSPGNTLGSKTISSKLDRFDNPSVDSYGYGTVNGAYIP